MNIYELLAFAQSKIPSQVKTHTIKNSKHDLPHFFSLGYWIFTLYWIFIQGLTADNIDFCYLVIDDQFNKKIHEIMRIIYRWLLVYVLFLFVKYGNQLEKIRYGFFSLNLNINYFKCFSLIVGIYTGFYGKKESKLDSFIGFLRHPALPWSFYFTPGNFWAYFVDSTFSYFVDSKFSYFVENIKAKIYLL